MKSLYVILVGLLFLPLAHAAGNWFGERICDRMTASSFAGLRKAEADMRKAEAAIQKSYDDKVTGWLEAQRKGQDGREFWCKDALPYRGVSLYGVSSYEVVDATKGYEQIVRVNHTTKRGVPIVSILTIGVSADVGIYNVERQGGW